MCVCVCHGVHARDSAAERERMERESILSEKIMGSYTLYTEEWIKRSQSGILPKISIQSNLPQHPQDTK